MKNRVITTLMSRARAAKAEHHLRQRAERRNAKFGAQIPKQKAKTELKPR